MPRDSRFEQPYDDRVQDSVPGATLRELREVNSKLEERLLKFAEEKRVLIHEVHHRVKNNMQIISSLLNMQAEIGPEGREAGRALKEASLRVHAMALVHEHFYQSDDLSRVDFASYVGVLAAELSQAYSPPGCDVQLQLQAEPILLTIEDAIPCGLVLHELLSNAMRHAFGGHAAGRITVRLQEQAGAVELEVSDNGIGLPPRFDAMRAETFGLQIVNVLSSQLKGRLIVSSQSGAVFLLKFSRR